jgi:hypothetical protein
MGGTSTPKQVDEMLFAQIYVSSHGRELDYDGCRRFVASGASSRCAHKILPRSSDRPCPQGSIWFPADR